LDYAACAGDVEVASLLVEAGADPSGSIVLGASSGSVELVTYLLSKGSGLPPEALVQAAKHGRTAVCELLIGKGIDPNARDAYGDCALHWAAKFGRTDTVTLLVRKGADPTARDKHGHTPIDHAKRNGFAEIVQFLDQAD